MMVIIVWFFFFLVAMSFLLLFFGLVTLTWPFWVTLGLYLIYRDWRQGRYQASC